MPKQNKTLLQSGLNFFNAKRWRSALLIAVAIGMAASASISYADSYDQQIQTLNNQNAAAQSNLSGLQAQASTYQGAINQVQAQIDALQAQINANQARQASLQQQIITNQADIATKKSQLGEDIKTMYVDGQMSTLEELASSKDLSAYVDVQEYHNTIQNQLDTKIKAIDALQVQLQKQKVELDSLIAAETTQNNQLAADRAQQADLLAYNEGQQANFTAQMQANNSRISALRAAQAAAERAAFAGSSSSTNGAVTYRNLTGQVTCGGGYNFHCGDAQDNWLDPWGEYNRECVSYTAWYEAQHGKYVPAFGYTVYGGAAQGNAANWHTVIARTGAADIVYASQAAANSSAVVGDVVYMPIGSVGHVGIVLSDIGDGWVHVGQYNLYGVGKYSEMDLKITPNIEFYHFH